MLTILIVQGAEDIPFDHREAKRLHDLTEYLIQITERNVEIAPE
jgi:hypothetical protein